MYALPKKYGFSISNVIYSYTFICYFRNSHWMWESRTEIVLFFWFVFETYRMLITWNILKWGSFSEFFELFELSIAEIAIKSTITVFEKAIIPLCIVPNSEIKFIGSAFQTFWFTVRLITLYLQKWR